MEPWIPLFDIFLNSPSPEMEASLWLQQSFNLSSPTRITTSSFLSLLAKPYDAIVVESSSSSHSSPHRTKRVMFIQTLPNLVQSRILSFLAVERQRFCALDLCRLAKDVLSGDQGVDFWVRKAAHQLFDVLSESNYDWISCLSLDSGEDREEEEFDSVPDWLDDAMATHDLVLPWLPISADELNSRNMDCLSVGREDDGGKDCDEIVEDIEIDRPTSVPLEREVEEMAVSLRASIIKVESRFDAIRLGNEICQLCMERGRDSFAVLGLIEPWNVDDEIASILISRLLDGSEQEVEWPSQVLASIILPKLLVLKESASRVLVIATLEYCTRHYRATVDALLFPLILRKEGINNPICDIITRIIRECLHRAHVSAFCQKLLCGGGEDRRYICHPCHEGLIATELVWTESLFCLFQNILTHNVSLTRDVVDHLAFGVQEMAVTFSKSLKFGNFLLCLVTKCLPLLKSHKLSLTEAAKHTNTLVTKSILSKLASF